MDVRASADQPKSGTDEEEEEEEVEERGLKLADVRGAEREVNNSANCSVCSVDCSVLGIGRKATVT